MTDTAAFVDELARSIVDGTAYPPFPDLDLAAGEQLQTALTAALGGPAGLKAGIGETVVQEMLGLDGPLLGFLYDGRQLADGVELAADPTARIECELGLRIMADGTIRAICPVVEVVRPEFATPSETTGPNLAACNVAADRVIVGAESPWTGEPTDAVIVTCDGATLLETTIDASLGGANAAHAWMLDETTRRGIELWDDLLFITGTCGAALPLGPGRYEVDVGGLGTLSFTAV